MEICRLEKITKSFSMVEVIYPIKELDLSINRGELITVEGVSGSGKTTLLNLLETLLKPDEGRYFFEGGNIYDYNYKKISEIRSEKIGFLFQSTNLIQALTLRENIEYVGKNVGVTQDEIDKMIEIFGLKDRQDYLPFHLSGGQKRRAGAVRSLIHEPVLILADEPTNDLDEHWANFTIDFLKKETDRGAAVVIATHNLNIKKYSDRNYFLKDGKLIEA